MTTQKQIKLLVNHTNKGNPIKSAIANQILNNLENTDVIYFFLEDFCSSELDELDLFQLLGMSPYNLYENMSFCRIKDNVKKNLFELVKELELA